MSQIGALSTNECYLIRSSSKKEPDFSLFFHSKSTQQRHLRLFESILLPA